MTCDRCNRRCGVVVDVGYGFAVCLPCWWRGR